MPKVTVEFDLPDEEGEYQLYLKSGRINSCLYELVNFFRSKNKYEADPATTWDYVYDKLWEILNDHGVNPWET